MAWDMACAQHNLNNDSNKQISAYVT